MAARNFPAEGRDAVVDGAMQPEKEDGRAFKRD
jgi:hypothetical protein